MSAPRTKTSRILYRESGASLLELMGAMVAGLVVLGGTLQSLTYFQQQFARQQNNVAQHQEMRLGLELFKEELQLAGFGSLTVILPDAVEFTANIHGLTTNVTSMAMIGQTTVAVNDGSGWPDHKLVEICWNEQCQQYTLARGGQRNLLTFIEPIAVPIPGGASVSVKNRLRYYCRHDEQGSLRFLRQIDGGSSVLIGNLESMTLSYWNEQGLSAAQPALVRRIVVELSLPQRAVKERREISLRT